MNTCLFFEWAILVGYDHDTEWLMGSKLWKQYRVSAVCGRLMRHEDDCCTACPMRDSPVTPPQ